MPRDRFLLGSESNSDVTFKSIRFGESLRIVGVSAEVVCEYAVTVRESAEETWVMPAGCMDDVAGYIPTWAMVREGGYESGGFCRLFSASGIPDDIEAATMQGLRAVLT